MTEPERAALLADLHTTPLGEERIRRNAAPNAQDVIAWCRERIAANDAVIERRGKNVYITSGGCTLTVNARSHTVITAHKKRHDLVSCPENSRQGDYPASPTQALRLSGGGCQFRPL